MSENRKEKGKKIPFSKIKENFKCSLFEVESFLRKSSNIYRVCQTRKLINSISTRKYNQVKKSD